MLPILLVITALLFVTLGISSFTHIKVDRYEYLKILSGYWKEARSIREEMEGRKGKRIHAVSYYNAMARLEAENLIERAKKVVISEDGLRLRLYFRLTPEGMKWLDANTLEPTSSEAIPLPA